MRGEGHSGRLDERHRYPWTPEEEAFLLRCKDADPKVTHKMIARELKRTPRSIDGFVARLKERGLL